MSSEVVSGIANETDLSESERAALIAFKTALNEQLPTIIPETAEMQIHANANPSDESFLYLLNTYVLSDAQIEANPQLQGLKDLYVALPENAQPVALPEQVTASAIESLSGSEQKLAEFKNTLNERLPEILPETADMSIHVNGDALDGSYIYLLQEYILNEDKLTATPALSELRDLYTSLPDDIRAQTETYTQFFAQPSGPDAAKSQGMAVVSLAERYLGTNDATLEVDEDTGRINIDERTARSLRERLEELQASETDIDVDFDPRVFDQRAVDFMKAVTEKRQRDANVQPSNSTSFLTQLWAIENAHAGADGDAPGRDGLAFGEASSISGLLNYMVNGELPSGATAPRPNTEVNWDTQWTNHDSGDRFFSSATYRDLYNNKTVTTDVLFDRASYSEENYDILLTAQERLGMTMERGVVLSEMQVGQLATEILSIRAQREWCFINPGEEFDESKIHEMIHDKQFMPHLDDLLLAEKGFGLPNNDYFQDKLDEYGTSEAWRLEYEERSTVIAYRARAFAERFGDMPESAIQEKAQAFGYSEQHVLHSYGLPSLYYNMLRSDISQQSPYEKERDQYLVRYQEFKEDVGSCNTAGANLDAEDDNPDLNVTDVTNGPCTVEGVLRGDGGGTNSGNNGPCTVEGVLRGDEFNSSADADETTSDCITTNIEDATGNPQGECTVEDEVTRRLERDAALQQ
ncbi:MAG: hypothetical protein ACTHOO_06445 [Alcanivorax sp.]